MKVESWEQIFCLLFFVETRRPWAASKLMEEKETIFLTGRNAQRLQAARLVLGVLSNLCRSLSRSCPYLMPRLYSRKPVISYLSNSHWMQLKIYNLPTFFNLMKCHKSVMRSEFVQRFRASAWKPSFSFSEGCDLWIRTFRPFFSPIFAKANHGQEEALAWY